MSEEINCDDGACEIPGEKSQIATSTNSDMDNKIIYVGDPMCSWCWGIAPEVDQLRQAYQGQLGFELVLGGLRPGGGDAWTDDLKKYISSHWEHVKESSGQPFDFDFFKRTSFNYDTEPSSRAVRVVRSLDPSKEWIFFKAVQQAFYAENMDVHDLATYEALCLKYDLNYADFESKYLSQEFRDLTKKDFEIAQMMGIRSFPSVALKMGGEYTSVSIGYSKFENMRQVIDSVIKK
tara:strand:+ start:1134 stop:1838 length:705 start_codon:yes stop_codon:yes gene_type:complete